MKNLLWLLSLVALVSPASAAPTAADAAWAEVEPLLQASAIERSRSRADMREASRARDARLLRLREKGLAFAQAFPRDPRRWHVVGALWRSQPSFIEEFGDDYERTFRPAKHDEARFAEWQGMQPRWLEQLEGASDLPPEVEAEVWVDRIDRRMKPIREALPRTRAEDWQAAWRTWEELARRLPESPRVLQEASTMMYVFDRCHTPEESAARWGGLATSPHAGVAALARSKLEARGRIAGPVDLRFTAIDGREVDLARMRGKVVMLDFWATWCVPCMRQKPYVIAAYNEFHAQGFEVVGISLDHAPDPAKPGGGAKTAAQVAEFARQHGMPWPQHYDGQGKANVLAQRFGVTTIPASFLLDQEGRVVAMNMRNDELADAVRRLLAPRGEKVSAAK